MPVRAIELNLPQRCASHIASLTDIEEAYNCGKTALLKALDGETDKMVVMNRTSEYHIEYELHSIDSIANLVKLVPDEFINSDHDGITDKFIDYAAPLILGESNITFENGFVRFSNLKKEIIEIK